MVTIFIFLFYLPKIYVHIAKKYKILFLLLTNFFYLLTITENSKLNSRRYFDLQSGSKEEKYNNKASIDLIYKFNPERCFLSIQTSA